MEGMEDDTLLLLVGGAAVALYLLPQQTKGAAATAGGLPVDVVKGFVDSSYKWGYDAGTAIKSQNDKNYTEWAGQHYSDFPGYGLSIAEQLRLGWNISPLGNLWPQRNGW